MAKGRRIDPDTAALLKGTAEHAEASRDLVDLTQREIAEAREHVDRSEVAIVESRKRLKRPRDPIALAKLIGDIATGQVEE
jgi:hypothetical protein